MSSFNDQLPLEDLYKKYLDTPANLRPDTFDDEDLLSVYDYAADIFDTETQEEILDIASALYSDDEEFLVRRAYFLIAASRGDEVDSIIRLLPESSLHRYIILARLDTSGKADAWENMCSQLLKAKRKSVDDEMVIRFFETIGSENQLDWIIDNQKQIEERCYYRDTFLYELAICCNDFHRYEKALTLAKELTVVDPFEAKFWYLLASIEGFGLGNIADAESDASYALAISPEFDHAKILLAYIRLLKAEGLEKGLSLVDEVIDADNDNADALVLGGLLACATGDRKRQLAYLSKLKSSRLDKVSYIAFDILLGSDNINLSGIKLSDIFLLYTDRLPHEITPEWLIGISNEESALIAALLILYDHNVNDGTLSTKALIVEHLDKARRPEDVITVVQDFLDNLSSFDFYGLILMYFYTKAGIATGNKKSVKPDLEFVISAAEQSEKNASLFFDKMQLRGLIDYLRKLYNETY